MILFKLMQLKMKEQDIYPGLSGTEQRTRTATLKALS